VSVKLRGVFLLCAVTLLAGCRAGVNKPVPVTRDADPCKALTAPDGVVFAAAPEWIDTAPLPRYCRVRGTIDGHAQFEMRLPERWNGRFMMAGCGGFCGALLPDKPGHANAINDALKRGYAAISHDGGHQGASWETGWASDGEALELFAYRILPVVANVGTQLATAMYGYPPRYKYFSGCSNGGRLGMMAAQRYPDLFDGIAAGSGIFDLSGIAGLWGNWLITTNTPSGTPIFPQAKVPLIEKLVLASCDALDGQVDQLIADPENCHVDFSAASCPAGPAVRDDCLTAQEAGLLNRLYGGVRNDRGDVVYPSAPYGSEHYSDFWLFGTAERPAWGALASEGYRHMLAASLSEKDAPGGLPTDQMVDWINRSPIPAMTNATDPDLSGLRRAGGKLLIYQGWSDPLIIPEPITHYFQKAADAAGGVAKLQANTRLFMIPGWGHCWEKPANAPDSFDPLSELENWVERGTAPDFIVARQLDKAGAELRSRPICSYPSTARLIEGKDPESFESYECISDNKMGGR
jgi:pimeloyl-ACP methyl ester carboxylesterase